LSLSEKVALVIEERTRKAYQKINEKNLVIRVEKDAAAAGAGIEVLNKN
jgi:hypothetical protein